MGVSALETGLGREEKGNDDESFEGGVSYQRFDEQNTPKSASTIRFFECARAAEFPSRIY